MAIGSGWAEAYESARREWPAIAVDFDCFREHGRRLGLGDAPTEEHLRDLFLACAALNRDEAAISIFDAEIVAGARGSIVRVHADPAFVEDVMQELRKKLLVGPEARLARYTGKSPLEAWVRVSAARLAYDVGRAQVFGARSADLDDLETLADQAAEPDLMALKKKLGPTFQGALRRAVNALSPHERTLLRMHLVQGLSIDQIARPYGVHRATAARWLASVKHRLIETVRAGVRDEHGPLSSDELHSLARLVASQLHLSLDRLTSSGDKPET